MYAMDAVELVEVTYQIGNLTPVKMFENIATGFYEAEISVESLSDDDYTLTITATDSVGLETEISTTITVDNSGPAITIAKPAKGKTVKGDVEFIVEVTDATGIATVQISIDKGEWKDMKLEDGKYVYNWNSRKFYNGKYDVDVRAVDTLGNEAKASSDINVDNFPMLAFLIFIIVLVIFLVLMIVSWGRKPKSKTPKIEEPVVTEESEVEPLDESTEGEEAVTVESFECPECGATVGSSDSVCGTCGVELEGEEKGEGDTTASQGFPEETGGL
jgi:flagellar hook assembly protein FlgD